MNATMLARSIVSGVASVPMDFYLGLERTFQDLNLSDGGRRIQSRNMHDDIRIGRVVYQAFKDRNEIAKIVKIIIDDSLQYLPEPVLRKVYDTLIGGATSMTSRTATQLSLSSYLGSKVVSGVMLSFISRVALRGLTGGVIAQGVISRACEASRRLQMQNPELWRKLRLNDYDMLYFMFEELLQNFIKMGEMLRKNPSASREFIHAIENYQTAP